MQCFIYFNRMKIYLYWFFNIEIISNVKNDFLALKLCIRNCLKKYKWNSNNRTGYQKQMIIELPFSRQSFERHFLDKLPLHNVNSNTIKLNVSVIDLEPIFGHNWYVMQNTSSTTQQRVMGMVSIEFRSKKVHNTCRDR